MGGPNGDAVRNGAPDCTCADACDEPLWSVFASKPVEALGEVGSGLAAAVGHEDPEGSAIQFKLLAISEHCCARFTCHEVFSELPVIP